MKNIDWLTTLATAFVTIMGTAAVMYFIQYSLIEKPKIEVENRRSSIDALKKIEEIVPAAEISCKAVALSGGFDWRLECSISNKGVYGFDASIGDSDVTLYNSGDLKVYEYSAIRAAGIEIGSLDSYSSSTHVQAGGGNLLFKSISMDHQNFKNGISEVISVRPCIRLKIKESLEMEYKRLFPELSVYIEKQNLPKLCSFVPLNLSKL